MYDMYTVMCCTYQIVAAQCFTHFPGVYASDKYSSYIMIAIKHMYIDEKYWPLTKNFAK